MKLKIAVIGGGITGTIAALEMADRGHEVIIFERESDIFQRASVANEGKIHLGYVYSADHSFQTAIRMIEDALFFRPIVERWLTNAEFDKCMFNPYRYLVPKKTRLPLEQIMFHFERVSTHLNEREQALGMTYLNQSESFHYSSRIVKNKIKNCTAFIDTQERGVCPQGIADAIKTCVRQHPRISVMSNVIVERIISGTRKGWNVLIKDLTHSKNFGFDLVINAACGGRRQIDNNSGFNESNNWYTRYKFGVLLTDASSHFSENFPVNSTAISGLFGDSVYYPQRDLLYCSWYPVGMCYASTQLVSTEVRPPLNDPEVLIRATWDGYATVDSSYNELASTTAPIRAKLVGDYIIAKGSSDIDDPYSRLHERQGHGPSLLAPGYCSIDSGKYTSAPRCALTCVEMMLGDV